MTIFLDELESERPTYLRNAIGSLDPALTRTTVSMPMTFPTLADFKSRAAEVLPKPLHPTFVYDNATRRNNLAAFERVKLRPRILVDITERRMDTEVLGQRISYPVMLAPTGTQMRVHQDGELASVRAAGDAGTIMALSHAASYTIEEVAKEATGPVWFQLYFLKDRAIIESVVRRAEAAGYAGLIATMDEPGIPINERDDRFARVVAADRRNANIDSDARRRLGIDNKIGSPWSTSWNDNSATWKDMEWLRSLTTMPLIIKGVQTAEDGRLCSEVGAAGLIVSNHGGDAMEDAQGTIDVLPEVIEAVGNRLEVFMDGGVSKGADILKALALGARAVFIGRPTYWGLAVDGEVGVRRVLAVLRAELDWAMAFCGITDARKVDLSVVKSPAGTSTGDSTVGDLVRLSGLLERGHLTREEFETEKTRLLGPSVAANTVRRS